MSPLNQIDLMQNPMFTGTQWKTIGVHARVWIMINTQLACISCLQMRPGPNEKRLVFIHSWNDVEQNISLYIVFAKLRQCQDHVHKWGETNRVEFDPAKEELVIMHPRNGYEETFRLLGLMVDNRLTMEEAVAKLLKQARPKCQQLLRTRAH